MKLAEGEGFEPSTLCFFWGVAVFKTAGLILSPSLPHTETYTPS